MAGTQGGKTSFGPPWLLREMTLRGPGDYLVVTPTYPLLELKLLPEFKRLFETYLKLGQYKGSPSRQFVLSPEGQKRLFGASTPEHETKIYFGHASDPDSLESATGKAAWLDECGQKKFKLSSYEAIRRRMALHRGRILMTTTPYTLGWLKQQIWDKRRSPGIRVVRFESILNPLFPLEEFEEARETLPAWKFNLFYRAIFTRPAGLIYDCFDEDVDKVSPFAIPDSWRRFVGVDFGGVHTRALFYAEAPAKGDVAPDLYLYKEYAGGNIPARDHVKAILQREPSIPFAVGGSLSEGNWRLEFRAAGLPIREPDIKDVEVGINRVYAMHKRNRIKVFKTCSGYLDEKTSYSRELNERDEPTEKIEDKSSYHYMDAERYIIGWYNRKGTKASADKIDWHGKPQGDPEYEPYRSAEEALEEIKQYEREHLAA